MSIELRSVTKYYKSNGSTPVVKDVSLSIAPGAIIGLRGDNGSGKTTILKMICGLISPSSGRVLVNGYDLAVQRRKALESLGVVLEGNRSFHWQLSPKQNLEYFGVLRGLDYRTLRNRIGNLLHLMDLERHKHDLCKNLSRGFQQRVAIALALITNPSVLLLDEPTLGLDQSTCNRTVEIIKGLESQEERTIFYATHNFEFAERIGNKTLHISNGRISERTECNKHLRNQSNNNPLKYQGSGEQEEFFRARV